MQTAAGARVFAGGEMFGVAQSRFVLAQPQDFCARGGGAQRQAAAQRAGAGRALAKDAVEQSEAGADGEKGGRALRKGLRLEARP